ncbi:hypothetical protein [Haloarcula sp. CBA1127]|uniref:hypothetical protein n=1 Tax=Haloarcula sp. CBA1127 TaxID=1765055 RepID=UPI000AEF51FA|nr:hypothetical protein [Haloarcula sp. CBA1127]
MPSITRRKLLRTAAASGGLLTATTGSARRVELSWKDRQNVEYVDTAFVGDKTFILRTSDIEDGKNEGLLVFDEDGLQEQISLEGSAFPADFHSLAAFDEEVLIVGENSKNNPVVTSITSAAEINWQTQASPGPYMKWVCANLANEQIILVGLDHGTATSRTKIAGIDRQSEEINWVVDAFSPDFFAESIHPYEDGCIIAGTTSTSEGHSWVARISSTGDILWERFYDDQEYANFLSVSSTGQGKIVLLSSDRESKTAYKLLTLDSDGQTISSIKESVPGEYDRSFDLFSDDPEGGYIVVSGQIASTLAVGKVDRSGRLQTMRTYSPWNEQFSPEAVHTVSNQIRVIGHFISPDVSSPGVVAIPRPLVGAETKTQERTSIQTESATFPQNDTTTTEPPLTETTDGSGPGLGLLTGIISTGLVSVYTVLKRQSETENR